MPGSRDETVNAEAERVDHAPDPLQTALRAIRTHLGMELAFISEFHDDQRTFRYVDSEATVGGVQPGVSVPLMQTYCDRVVRGALPEMSGKAEIATVPPDAALTAAIPIRSYASVPIRLSDGSLFGTFCAIGISEDETLNERDLKVIRAFADMAAVQIEQTVHTKRRRTQLTARISSILANDALTVVYQPIVDVIQKVVVGFEALSRFGIEPVRSPDVWFAEAGEVGMDALLERRAIEKALAELPNAPPETYISVNASPAQITSGEFDRAVTFAPPDRVVLEITEHAMIEDYDAVARACATLRTRGIRIAIDDAGSGYASFRHILSLQPDFIKLDRSLTLDLERDPRRQALVASFVAFAGKTGSELIAEGVETPQTLQALKDHGVTKAQGFLLGRPGPIERHAVLGQVVQPFWQQG